MSGAFKCRAVDSLQGKENKGEKKGGSGRASRVCIPGVEAG